MDEQAFSPTESQFPPIEEADIKNNNSLRKIQPVIFLLILLVFLVCISTLMYSYMVKKVKKSSTLPLSHRVSVYKDGFPKSAPVNTPTSAPANNNLFVFRDTLDATSLTIEIATASPQFSYFIFATPNAQYTVDGDTLQSSSDGTLTLNYQGTAQKSTTADWTTKTTVPIAITAHILPQTFQASASFTDEVTNQSYNLTTDTPDEASAVDAFNHAMLSQDWQTLFSLTVSDDTAGMTPDQFATAMKQQTVTTGAVTDITVTNISPVIRNPAGISTFTTEEEMTLRKNNVSTKQNITSAFVLDSGRWKFWFSNVNN